MNGRGVEIFVECDARQSIAALAEPLSSLAAGDLFGTEGGYGAGARFLEYLLEGEEAVFEVSQVDAGDEKPRRLREDVVAAGLRINGFDFVVVRFD